MQLDSPLSLVKGVGEKTADVLSDAGLLIARDIINFLPRRYDDFTGVSSIANLQPGKVVVRARCESVSTRHVRRGLRLTTAVLSDETGKVKAVWFNQPYRETQLKSEHQFMFSGEFSFEYNQYQLTNPSVERVDASSESPRDGQQIVPIYKQRGKLKSRTTHSIISQLEPLIRTYPETLPEWVVKSHELVSRADALGCLHFPTSADDVKKGKRRLAFEELFEMLLAAQLNKVENTKLAGWLIKFEQPVVKEFVDALPFALTNAQRRTAWQILQDFESQHPMNRLLQGDVGSGKTVVAGLAARQATRAGFQTAFMAPTEILAKQHAETLGRLLEPLGVSVALLTGSASLKERNELLPRIESGEVDVVVGTHALIQPKMKYHKLGFVVIDEQHRFGVKQRQALLTKSDRMPHLLSMTATPIPRSLALTLYGELDISILDEMPPGRQSITTKIWSPVSRDQLYQAIGSELDAGRQAYVICSLIDDNPDNDKQSVEAIFRKLKNSIFAKYQIATLHGKLSSGDKQQTMQRFTNGEIDILVSTTVVEVGVDVPNATVMMIENADHFGLSQLHQLRGRVGRGQKASYCHLVMSDNSKPSLRLKEIEKSQDGFHLAEVDLALRGPGEVYGQAQHGALRLQIASLADSKLVAEAQQAARQFVDRGEDLLQYKQLASAVENYQRLTTLN